MYKILLVDDEDLVVEGLKSAIQWEKHQFTVIGQAYNGTEAYELIHKMRPDVVFMDIRMPGMNGLELIKKVKEDGIDAQFVIASGYAEFAYAQKAMHYGAIDYCLKPFEDMEIIRSLDKARCIIEEREKNKEYEIMEMIEAGNIENETVTGGCLEKFGLDTAKKEIFAIVSIGKDEIKFPDEIKHLRFKAGLQKRVYLVEADCLWEMKEYLGNQVSGSIKGIGISRKVKKTGDVKNAIDEANIAACQFFISGRNGIAFYDNFERSLTKINSFLRQLNESIRDRSMTSVDIYINDLSCLFNSGLYNIKHAHIIHNMVMLFIYSYAAEFGEGFIDNYEHLFDLYKNIEHMFYILKNHISRQIGFKTEPGMDEPENNVIKEVINYLNKNFYKDIYIQNLSEIYYITPNYLSRLFKREIGQNFTEYLSKIRIEYACSLLRETKLSIQQISERSGYNDYFYFARIFKKSVGKTPGAYRNEIS